MTDKEVAPNASETGNEPTISELGQALLDAARVKFPSQERCRDCGFRGQYHEPSNHPFNEVVDPFVVALEGFVKRVATGLEGQVTE